MGPFSSLLQFLRFNDVPLHFLLFFLVFLCCCCIFFFFCSSSRFLFVTLIVSSSFVSWFYGKLCLWCCSRWRIEMKFQSIFLFRSLLSVVFFSLSFSLLHLNNSFNTVQLISSRRLFCLLYCAYIIKPKWCSIRCGVFFSPSSSSSHSAHKIHRKSKNFDNNHYFSYI